MARPPRQLLDGDCYHLIARGNNRQFLLTEEAAFHYFLAITLYSLRHTSATDWLDAAATRRRDVLPYVQRQLGHESLESTAIYTHVAIEPLRRMFKDYHPREQQWAVLAKIPASPDDLRAQWDAQRKPPPPESPLP